MSSLFPTRGFRRTRERSSGLLFALGVDDLSTTLTTGQTLTFERDSTRTVFDSAGRLTHVAHSQPAWSSVYNSESAVWEPTLDIQNQSTNLVRRSENFGTLWTAVGTPTRTATAATCGDLELDLIGDDAAGTLEGYTQSVTLTGNTQKGVSIFLKAGTSTSTVVRLRDTTAAATRCQMTVAWSGGVPTVTATTGVDAGTLACANGVYRLRFQSNSCTAANAHLIEVYPATNAALATTQTGTVYAGGVQVEDFGTPTAYIKTTSATVTREKDYYTPTINFGVQDLTVYVRTVNYTGINGAAFMLGAGGSAGVLYVVRNGSNTVAHLNDGAGTNRNTSVATPATSVFEYVAQYVDMTTAPRCRINAGAGFSSYTTAGTAITSWATSTLLIGSSSPSNTGTDALNSGVRRIIIAPGQRSLADMQGLAV